MEEQNYFKEKKQWNKIFHVDEKEELSESTDNRKRQEKKKL